MVTIDTSEMRVNLAQNFLWGEISDKFNNRNNFDMLKKSDYKLKGKECRNVVQVCDIRGEVHSL